MSKLLNAKEVNKKYKDKYIEIIKTYDYSNQQWLYEVTKVHKTIHENGTLGQDVGTSMEYMR